MVDSLKTNYTVVSGVLILAGDLQYQEENIRNESLSSKPFSLFSESPPDQPVAIATDRATEGAVG